MQKIPHVFETLCDTVWQRGVGGALWLHRVLRCATKAQASVPSGENREKEIETQLGDVTAVSAASRVRASGLMAIVSLIPYRW